MFKRSKALLLTDMQNCQHMQNFRRIIDVLLFLSCKKLYTSRLHFILCVQVGGNDIVFCNFFHIFCNINVSVFQDKFRIIQSQYILERSRLRPRLSSQPRSTSKWLLKWRLATQQRFVINQHNQKHYCSTIGHRLLSRNVFSFIVFLK